MKVLVTGHAGFIGSHIADELLRVHNVGGLDCRSGRINFAPPGLAYDSRECLSNEAGTSMLPEVPEADCIVHCAARADVANNWKDEIERFRLHVNNVEGTLNLLEASNDMARKPSVVFLSTCAVYGDAPEGLEVNPCVATSPYAASKLAGEALVQSYCHKWGTPWYVLRLAAVVGDRYHHGHIADFVTQAKHGRVKPLTDGRGKRAAVHVLDVADAVGMCVRGELSSGVYNVVAGVWSARDTARVMGVEDTHFDWPYEKPLGWVGDTAGRMSAGRLRNGGWQPKRSIEDGVREALGAMGWRKHG